jgi:uncharacterized protein
LFNGCGTTTLNVYFDASLVASLLLQDALTERAEAYLAREAPSPVISDWAAAEVAGAFGVRLRRGELDEAGAKKALGQLDAWRTIAASRCAVEADDIVAADGLLRRFDLALRAPDALHLAIARRLAAPLATFDSRMRDAAAALGLQLAPI